MVEGQGGGVGGPSVAGSAALMDRTELYTVLAAVRDDEDILASSENRAAYDRLRQQCENLATTAEAVETDLSALKKARGSNVIAELQLPTYEQGAVRRYDFGTAQETVMQDFPDYLRATVDGKSKILTGITEWRVDRVFGAPGTYAFTPVLPERYKNYTVVCDYPDIQVTVLPPAGDMNGDGAVSIADAELLAAYYNGTRQLAQVQLAAADHQTNADIRGGCIAYILSYQKEDGSCSFGDAVNCESTAQVVTACAALGIDPHTDSRFVKNGKPAGGRAAGLLRQRAAGLPPCAEGQRHGRHGYQPGGIRHDGVSKTCAGAEQPV